MSSRPRSTIWCRRFLVSHPRLAAAAAIEREPGIAGKAGLAPEGTALVPSLDAMKVAMSFCENARTDGIGIGNGIAPETGTTETGIGTGAMDGDVTVPAVSPETATAIRGAGGHLPENANEHEKMQPSATHGEAAAGGEEEISPMSRRRHRWPGRVKALRHLLQAATR